MDNAVPEKLTFHLRDGQIITLAREDYVNMVKGAPSLLTKDEVAALNAEEPNILVTHRSKVQKMSPPCADDPPGSWLIERLTTDLRQ